MLLFEGRLMMELHSVLNGLIRVKYMSNLVYIPQSLKTSSDRCNSPRPQNTLLDPLIFPLNLTFD